MAAGTAVDALRESDPDRYLSVLYAPADRRPALTALYLFNAEVAAIRERVSEPLPGEIRLQWWRDALSGEAEGASANPVAHALLQAMERYALPRDAFERYLDARIFDLYDDPMPSRSELEGYCGETASAIIQLAALILDPDAAGRTGTAAGHAGCAQAIAGLLRLLPIHRARGQCYLPAEILAAAGLTADQFNAEATDTEAKATAVRAMAALGRDHLAAFEAAAAGLPASLRPAYLPAATARPHLGAVEKAPEKALTRPAGAGPLRRHAAMLRRAVFGWSGRGRKGAANAASTP